MTLSNGREYLAIPGPSVIPDRVLRAMHRGSPNIYEGELVEMVPGILRDLKSVARTRNNVAIYITNGHGTWEAALTNIVSRGDKVLIPATGNFALEWAEICRGLGLNVELMDFGKRAAIDPEAVGESLAQDQDGLIKAVLAVHVDTATSIRSDIKALSDAMSKTGHPALLVADCVASLGCDVFEMDAWGVDVMITASQKGLMTPPGVGFVFFNEKADKARDIADCVTPYWDWRPRTAPDIFYQYFCGTAPTVHLFGLRVALDMIAQEGLENVWARHHTLAQAIWAAFEHWGQGGSLELNVANASLRSHAVTSIRAGSNKATGLRQWCQTKAGLTLGIGLGMAPPNSREWHHFFRLGHMGHVNAQMILGALATIESGMKAVGIEHASGGI